MYIRTTTKKSRILQGGLGCGQPGGGWVLEFHNGSGGGWVLEFYNGSGGGWVHKTRSQMKVGFDPR